MERLYEHSVPADTEEVNSPSGADAYAIIGMGATGGVLVESLYKIGFDNVFLVGRSDIEPIGIPTDRKLVLTVSEPTSMEAGEHLAALNQQKIFDKMKNMLGLPSRVFVCIGCDGGLSAGSTLVMVECAQALLKLAGFESGQRVGVFVAYPTFGELSNPKIVKDAKFLVERLFDLNQRKFLDPLVIGDRSNICSLFDGLSVPAEETETVDGGADTVTEEKHAEQQPNAFGNDLYEE